MQRVLVAGSTGYLGRFVLREFKERGYWVRALARNPEKLEQIGPFQEPAVIDKVDDVFAGEVTKPETLNRDLATYSPTQLTGVSQKLGLLFLKFFLGNNAVVP